MTKSGDGILRSAQEALDYVCSNIDNTKVNIPNTETLEAIHELESDKGVCFKNKEDFYKDVGL